MRKLSLLLLLATAAAPAMAQDHDRSGRQHRNDSSEQTESRPQRSSETRSNETRSSVQRTERSGGGQAAAVERIREHRQQRIEAAQTQPAQPAGEDNVRVRRGGGDGDNVRVRRGSGNGDNVRVRTGDGAAPTGSSTTNWRERERRVRTIPDTQPTVRQPSASEREAFQRHNRRDYRDGRYTRWSDNWRHDRRYNWSSYRNQHRSIFRLGSYYDPFGWGYRSWSIGSFLYPSYYGSSFWLNDPYQYRLPPAYGPYRWVRYWNDALLVNIYTGQVVDVMHGFFW